eukprot:TRINITY_DN788_c0_g1_i1.p1 TRINITY_DN788_c0_g1~~TRINITY_DN788_c0_g1_i1.p1  ORF type:complete len:304 (+),score=47.20 TRINITY_DN788_c0_g1_i1:675-1586(+)
MIVADLENENEKKRKIRNMILLFLALLCLLFNKRIRECYHEFRMDRLFRKLKIAVVNGEINEVEYICNRILDNDTENAEAYYYLGLAHLYLDNYESALDHFKTAVNSDNLKESQVVSGLSYSASCYCSLELYDESLSVIQHALDINPTHIASLMNKGEALTGMGRYNEAINCYDKILEIDAYNESALLNKGHIYLDKTKQYDLSAQIFKNIVEKNPLEIDSGLKLGLSYKNMKNYKQALIVLDNVLTRMPNHFVTLRAKGEVLYDLGEYEQALEMYEKANYVKPGTSSIKWRIYQTKNKLKSK